jgi:hypothetical protein
MAAKRDSFQNLGDGLVMRRATARDRERVADFHANTLLELNETPPLERLRGFVLDLMSGEHPTTGPGDFTLVEDTATGKIVSSMVLMSQTWTYEGIPFPFGQPDVVSTDPAYRRRGLVRAQMNEVHRWSAERGELVQGITGIPWYYRQFGYEMALNLDGRRQGSRSQVPRLKEGEVEAYRFRAATVDDVPFIMTMYRQAASRSVIASVRDEALWRYDIEGRSESNGFRSILRIIETPQGEPVGLLVHSWRLWDEVLGIRLYEVAPGVPYLAVTPGVMRYLDAMGEEYAKRDTGDGAGFEAISFNLGETHPVYDAFSERLPVVGKPYAWYIRVPDLLAFVRHIASALEKRLAGSAQAGYTGQMKVSFFRSGLIFNFQEGSISVEGWKPEHIEEGDAAFPDLTFLQLLFGYRSLEELQYAFADCSANTDEARALLPLLFPRKSSNVRSGG